MSDVIDVFDAAGNPDVMGSRPLNEAQSAAAEKMRLECNLLITRMHGSPGSTPEALRLYAIARTHLELACMAAVKAISRDS